MGGMRDRQMLLSRWAHLLADAAGKAALTRKPITITQAYVIAGPRAGAVELFAWLQSGALLSALSANDCAMLRPLVPWHFVGDPQIYMAGRFVRVEAAWSDDLAEKVIRLPDLCDKPEKGGRWIAGKSETGATIVPGLSDSTPHFLVSGATGSGKSVALRSAVLQLSADADNHFILADGKGGESLKALEHLPNVLGPCAIEGPDIRNALGYAVRVMHDRAGGNGNGRLVVVLDEFQELVQDPVIVDLMRKLAAQGRSRHVHLLAATQHPTVDTFGHSSTRRNLTGKCALRVGDPAASGVAVGGNTPRADHLLGAGDSYLIAPDACHRVQLAYVDENDIAAGTVGGVPWRFQRWPEYDPGSIGQELPAVGWHYTGDELAVSIVAAANGEGRPSLMRRLEEAELGCPGAPRAIRLLRLGRDAHDWLTRNDYAVCLSANTTLDSRNVRIIPEIW